MMSQRLALIKVSLNIIHTFILSQVLIYTISYSCSEGVNLCLVLVLVKDLILFLVKSLLKIKLNQYLY